MSQTPIPSPDSKSHKTLAIRLDNQLHAQISAIAKLSGRSLVDEIRLAIEQRIEMLRSDADLTAKADEALEEIEREARARREAIASLFGDQATEESQPAKPTRRTRGASEG